MCTTNILCFVICIESKGNVTFQLGLQRKMNNTHTHASSHSWLFPAEHRQLVRLETPGLGRTNCSGAWRRKTETGSVWEEVGGNGRRQGWGAGLRRQGDRQIRPLKFYLSSGDFFLSHSLQHIIKRIHAHYRERRNQKGRKPQSIPTVRRCHRTFQLIAILCGRLWFRRWCWG